MVMHDVQCPVWTQISWTLPKRHYLANMEGWVQLWSLPKTSWLGIDSILHPMFLSFAGTQSLRRNVLYAKQICIYLINAFSHILNIVELGGYRCHFNTDCGVRRWQTSQQPKTGDLRHFCTRQCPPPSHRQGFNSIFMRVLIRRGRHR